MPLPVVGAAIAAGTFSIGRYLVPAVVKWVLISLGMGVATFIGVDALKDYVINYIQNSWSGLPAETASYLEYCGVLSGLNIVVSSFAASLTIKFSVAAKALRFK